MPELCSESSNLRVASLYGSSRSSTSAAGASSYLQYQSWQHAASRHRSAGVATSAVRLRRKGSQPQRKPAHTSEEVTVQQISVANGPSDSTGSNGTEPKGPRSLPYQQSAESAAEDLPVSAQQAGQQTQQAIRQQSKAAGGIQAADWLTDNAVWVADQTPPSDGPTWPSDLAWTPERAGGVHAPQRVRAQLDGEAVEVLPLWVAVHQQHDGAVARLYESICPLSEELVAQLTCHMEPFCITNSLAFSRCQERAGPWRNYFIGVIGTFAPDEDDVLWPNQVLYGLRTMFNVRNGQDLAQFLADPQREEFDSHSSHLSRIQTERGYRKAWTYHRLRTRWGDETLAEFGVVQDSFQ